jgi:Trk K+ transport system NAD-binding subunit
MLQTAEPKQYASERVHGDSSRESVMTDASGDNVIMVVTTSGNKGIAIRSAVERSIASAS